MAETVKNQPAMWETWVQSLGWEDPVGEDMATPSSILAWRVLMDRGDWRAAVPGVAESDAAEQLSIAQHKRFYSHSHSGSLKKYMYIKIKPESS